MKIIHFSLGRLAMAATLALLFGSGGTLLSQTSQDQPAPEQAQAAGPQTPEQRLAELKAANAALLKQQAATLEQLDALIKEAEQLRIFAKRS